ncbi:MAG: putative amidohydrolase YtcJ [Glaciecola sp.]|jgi:predicted amidohydrolase YtcJ
MAERSLLRDVRIDGRAVDLLIASGRIVAIGAHISPREARTTWQGRGRDVLPGLRDAHVHFTDWALARSTSTLSRSLRGAVTVEEIVNVVHAAALRGQGADWVIAEGFQPGALTGVAPHKSQLDEALPGLPIALTSVDGHSAWLSSAALAQLGLDHDTGLLREHDVWAMESRLPWPATVDLDDLVNGAVGEALALGVTSIVDYQMRDGLDGWLRRAAHEPLRLRVEAAVMRHELDEAIADGRRTGQRLAGSDRLTIGRLKLFADGALGSRTAGCDHGYVGDQGNRGLLLFEEDELAGELVHAARHGFEATVHAIGDRANAMVLNAFARTGLQGRVEHAQLLRRDDMSRMAGLGLEASVQPIHAVDDRDLAERWWSDRLDRAYCHRSLALAGVPLLLGTDAPVANFDPWANLAAACNRTIDDRPPWLPDQRLELGQAVRAATVGELEVGAPADLLVMDQPIRAETLADLAGARPVATMLAGDWVSGPPE